MADRAQGDRPSRFDRYFRRHPGRFPVLIAVLGWLVGAAMYGAVVGVTVVYGSVEPTWYVIGSVAAVSVLPAYIGYRHAITLQAAVTD